MHYVGAGIQVEQNGDAEETRLLAQALEESRRELRLPRQQPQGFEGSRLYAASSQGLDYEERRPSEVLWGSPGREEFDTELQRALEASREQTLIENTARSEVLPCAQVPHTSFCSPLAT